MNTFRLATSPQLCAAGNAVASIPESTDSEIHKLAGDIARLAARDPATAAELVHELLALAPSSDHAKIGTAIAAHLDDPTLSALARSSIGRELLDTIDRHGSAGLGASDTQRQLGRIRDALQGADAGSAPGGGGLAHLALRPMHLNVAPSAGRQTGGDAAAKQQVQGAFKEEFAARAGDKEGFHAFMQQVFGDGYDRNLAEQYRQNALAGDFSFLPDVQFVDAGTLGGANGAYDAQRGVVYINRDLAASDPGKAAQTFVEEAGHHLDAKLNTSDTQGDEGEMFRRVLAGEQLGAQQVAAIRNENDKGTIVVDGKRVEVEFWFGEDLWEGAKDIVTSAVDKGKEVVSDVADHVGTAATDVVYSVGDMIKEGTMGLVDGAGLFVQGLAQGVGGAAINLLEGRVADAWDSLVNGVDKMVIQAPRRIVNGALESAGHWVKTPTYLLPRKAGGDFLRGVVDRGIDNLRTVANGAIDIARNVIRLPFEVGVGFMKDVGEALRYWARGDVGEGFERFGLAFVHPFKRVGGAVVDSAMIFGQGVGNVFGNTFGIHEPSRGLNKAEREYLRNVYGDSLNLEDIRIHKGNLTHGLGMAPHCVGNDIYLPDEGPDNCFNPDGSLNEKGRQTLLHEAFHVYQAQHGGNDYIHGALLANAEGIVDSGERSAAYDWTVPFKAGKPFAEWNPEAQAEFLETMGKARQGTWDLNGDGIADGAYDLNGNGQVEKNEFELAWSDRQWTLNREGEPDILVRPDGMVTSAKSAGLTSDPEPALLDLTPEEFQRLMAIWDAVKADRPDRTVV
jgi:hypothetical protein